MYARNIVLPDRSYSHVFFRAHARQHFFAKPEVKCFLLNLWAKYKQKYRIKILEFIIMDNHAHAIVWSECTYLLGDFMRNVNSQLARYINKLLDRDSQAIKERYKSPWITTTAYLKNVAQYVWFNRAKVMDSDPRTDPYCSLSWRLSDDPIERIALNDEEKALLENLLDHDPAIYPEGKTAMRRFVIDLFNAANARLESFKEGFFTKGHTIGDEATVAHQTELVKAHGRVKPPPRTDLLD